MYNNYFGFREKPFKLVPNPYYLFLSKTHEIALAHLNYAADQGEGFVVIVGEVGTGKTTLCRNYLESLDEQTDSAYIFNPHLDTNELLVGICHEYGIRTSEKGTKALLDILNEFLIRQNAKNRKVVLLIDEAQLLSTENLEMIRMLSNLETTRNKLLQIILVGQPELAKKLETYELRQLAQRISLNYQLTPLSVEDTEAYIRHRIGVASQRYSQLFTTDACRLAHRFSQGIPRLINIAADRALLVAFSQDQPKVTKSVMRTAVSELTDTAKAPSKSKSKSNTKLVLGLSLSGVIVILAAVFFLLYNNDIAPFQWSGAHMEGRDRSTEHSLQSKTYKVPIDDLATSPSAKKKRSKAEEPTLRNKAVQKVVDQRPGDTDKRIQGLPIKESTSSGTATSTVTPIDQVEIEKLLSGLDPFKSRKDSAAMLLSIWQQPGANVDLIPDEVDNSSFFDIAARQYGLREYEVKGNWELVQKIDLPAIIALTPPGRKQNVYMSLIGLRGNLLQLTEREGGNLYEMDFVIIKPYFRGAVHIFWKNIIGFDMIIGYGSDDRAVMMVKNLLRKIGYNHITLSPEFDYDTRLAIRDFQKSHQLKVDGLVGPLTKLMLLREAGTAQMPNLKKS